MRQFQEINDLYPETLRSENYIIYKQILEESHLSLYTNNIGELYKDQLVLAFQQSSIRIKETKQKITTPRIIQFIIF